MANEIYSHTLSFPEHLWLDFFRTFFSQKTLLVDSNLKPVVNNFLYEIGQSPSNRQFDISLESELKKQHPDMLPSLVLEDLGMSSLHIALNRLKTWNAAETSKEYTDLIRCTYVMHCCSKDRGESRLLAAIVANAITVFYEELKREGFHKIEPWSIGKTTPVKIDSEESYIDTPISVTFEFQENWKTIEDGPTGRQRFCFDWKENAGLHDYIRASIDISDPSAARYVSMSMNVQDAHDNIYVNTSLDLMDASSDDNYIRTSVDINEPTTAFEYVRTSMRIAT